MISMDYDYLGSSFTLLFTPDRVIHNNYVAKTAGCFFAVSSTLLLASIIRVISTNPGGIPEDREWDIAHTHDDCSQSHGDTSSATVTEDERETE